MKLTKCTKLEGQASQAGGGSQVQHGCQAGVGEASQAEGGHQDQPGCQAGVDGQANQAGGVRQVQPDGCQAHSQGDGHGGGGRQGRHGGTHHDGGGGGRVQVDKSDQSVDKRADAKTEPGGQIQGGARLRGGGADEGGGEGLHADQSDQSVCRVKLQGSEIFNGAENNINNYKRTKVRQRVAELEGFIPGTQKTNFGIQVPLDEYPFLSVSSPHKRRRLIPEILENTTLMSVTRQSPSRRSPARRPPRTRWVAQRSSTCGDRPCAGSSSPTLGARSPSLTPRQPTPPMPSTTTWSTRLGSSKGGTCGRPPSSSLPPLCPPGQLLASNNCEIQRAGSTTTLPPEIGPPVLLFRKSSSGTASSSLLGSEKEKKLEITNEKCQEDREEGAKAKDETRVRETVRKLEHLVKKKESAEEKKQEERKDDEEIEKKNQNQKSILSSREERAYLQEGGRRLSGSHPSPAPSISSLANLEECARLGSSAWSL